VETAEIKIEVTFEKHLESKILKALLAIMFEEWPTKFMLQNTHQNIGLGMIEFENSMEENDFLRL
jgi:hypothetical protein